MKRSLIEVRTERLERELVARGAEAIIAAIDAGDRAAAEWFLHRDVEAIAERVCPDGLIGRERIAAAVARARELVHEP